MMPNGVLNMPDKIGGYEVESVIGKGTMGIVYKGKDPTFKRHVALKTIHPHLVNGPDDRLIKRSRAEADALGTLNHPNIVTIYDLIDHEGMPVIVMELAEGKTLYDHLAANPKVGVRDAMKIISQILDALEYAHGRGLIHRDIKPANIMIRERSTIKVMDFGVAKIQDSDATMKGEVFGAPNYMSPEQWRGKEVDVRTDIFAVGVLFYQLLTGVKPFEGDNFHQTRENVLTLDPEPPSYINPIIPSELNEIVLKAMARDRDQRYETAAEFRHAIEAAEETMLLPKDPTLPGAHHSDGTLRPVAVAKRPAWLIPSVVAALVLMLGGIGWMVWPDSKKPEPAIANIPAPPPVGVPQPPAPTTGRVDIRSEPSGARVTMINGDFVGVTPLTVNKSPGLYKFIIQLDGFEASTREVDVLSDKIASVTESLKPVAPPPTTTAAIAIPPRPEPAPVLADSPITPEPPISAPPRPSRVELQRELQLFIRRAGFRGIRVAITRDYVAIISGTVARVSDREQVISIVQNHAAIGNNFVDTHLRVSGEAPVAVAESPVVTTERPIATTENPKTKIRRELVAKLRGQGVAFRVLPNLRVLLTGRLASQDAMDNIIQMVQSTEGVTGIVNKIKLRGGTTVSVQTQPASSSTATTEAPTSGAVPIERMVKNINGALSQAKLQGGGSRTQIVAKNTGWNVIVISGSAEHQQQVNAAMQIARHAAAGNVQVKNDITVLGN